MSTVTPINGFTIPQLGDAPNIETAIHPLANALDGYVVSRHANVSARAAAIPSPAAGMVSYRTDSDDIEYYDGVEWLPLTGLWVTYSPTFTSSGGGAAVGNGTLVGKYMKRCKTITLMIRLTLGSTTTFGTGYIQFSTPVTALNTDHVGPAGVQDISANSFTAACHLENTNTVTPYSASGVISSTSPFTWAAGDIVRLTISYEV